MIYNVNQYEGKPHCYWLWSITLLSLMFGFLITQYNPILKNMFLKDIFNIFVFLFWYIQHIWRNELECINICSYKMPHIKQSLILAVIRNENISLFTNMFLNATGPRYHVSKRQWDCIFPWKHGKSIIRNYWLITSKLI